MVAIDRYLAILNKKMKCKMVALALLNLLIRTIKPLIVCVGLLVPNWSNKRRLHFYRYSRAGSRSLCKGLVSFVMQVSKKSIYNASSLKSILTKMVSKVTYFPYFACSETWYTIIETLENTSGRFLSTGNLSHSILNSKTIVFMLQCDSVFSMLHHGLWGPQVIFFL